MKRRVLSEAKKGKVKTHQQKILTPNNKPQKQAAKVNH
jgi:hypothetical protein